METESPIEGNIENLAEQAARELLETVPALKTAQQTERNALIALVLHAEKGNAARLVAAFSGDSSFGDLRDGWIRCGSSGRRMQPHMFPHFLINKVLDGFFAKPLVEQARAFAQARRSATEWYTPLAGVTVEAALNLGNHIDLVPWVNVSNGDHKILFQPDLSTSIAHMRAMPNSAFRTRFAECQVLFSSYEEAKAAMEASHSEIKVMSARIQDIVRCITMLSVSPVAILGSWMQFDRTIANGVYGTPYSYTEFLFDNTLYMTSFNPVPLDGKEAMRLLQLFENFKPPDKQVMRIALDRLNQALRRQNAVDKAIDFGVALEVMLLHDLYDNYRGELRFRSSIRGATFLGGAKRERLKTLKVLKDAYDLRSQAVHSGVLKARKGRPLPEQVLHGAMGCYAHIARRLIERGSFPDWDTEYVIGGE